MTTNTVLEATIILSLSDEGDVVSALVQLEDGAVVTAIDTANRSGLIGRIDRQLRSLRVLRESGFSSEDGGFMVAKGWVLA